MINFKLFENISESLSTSNCDLQFILSLAKEVDKFDQFQTHLLETITCPTTLNTIAKLNIDTSPTVAYEFIRSAIRYSQKKIPSEFLDTLFEISRKESPEDFKIKVVRLHMYLSNQGNNSFVVFANILELVKFCQRFLDIDIKLAANLAESILCSPRRADQNSVAWFCDKILKRFGTFYVHKPL